MNKLVIRLPRRRPVSVPRHRLWFNPLVAADGVLDACRDWVNICLERNIPKPPRPENPLAEASWMVRLKALTIRRSVMMSCLMMKS